MTRHIACHLLAVHQTVLFVLSHVLPAPAALDCYSETAPQTLKHMMQSCPLHREVRNHGAWITIIIIMIIMIMIISIFLELLSM